MRQHIIVGLAALAVGCGGSSASPDAAPECAFPLDFEEGGDGHPDPLGAGPGEARAGRLAPGMLPQPGELDFYRPGDFLLANDRVALVIESARLSDGYDPWGGKPALVARVEGGQLVGPSLFNEILLLTNRESLVAQSVTVLSDGSDGGAAVVRAHGFLAPTPFFDNIVGSLLRETHPDIPTAIDYVLEPGAEHVDVFFRYRSPRLRPAEVSTILHGFLYGKRMPTFGPAVGFDTEGGDLPWLGFIDDAGTGYAYSRESGTLDPGIEVSGFVSRFGGEYVIAPCGETTRHHARLTIAGPGLDPLVQAVARWRGDPLRAITGTVRNADMTPAAGVRVHAQTDTGAYLTRATTDESGAYALHVPDGQAVHLTAYRRGDDLVEADLTGTETSRDFTLAPTGWIDVVTTDADTAGALPVKIQVLDTGQGVPAVPASFGEAREAGGRLHVEYAMNGEALLRAPVGDWEVVVSRGYEYEIHRQIVSVTAGGTATVSAVLQRVVDTAGVQCADYHIHTSRSADSGDDPDLKVRAAVADGLEIPVRSDHEFAIDFQPNIERQGLGDWAFGVPSVELTSMEIWGHMGVIPLLPDATQVNGGTPLWQTYPTPDEPGIEVTTLSPADVFAQVRARPEAPVIIINHPRGGNNYFEYVGYDPVTGMVAFPEGWDEEFHVVEVFNDSGWLSNLNRTVKDWFSLLSFGRRVYAVGSSDSHGISGSPVGYPRTCLRVGTDDPRQLTHEMVRDATGGGHSVIVGGIFLEVSVGPFGPGDEILGSELTTNVRVRVQAPTWVDVDFLDVVVDGTIVQTIPILPGDADPGNPVVRFDKDVPIQRATDADGSYVVFAAYGDRPLEPVHPGRAPFAVSNPIFLLP